MNALLPEDLSYYEQRFPKAERSADPAHNEGGNYSSLWDGPSESEMDSSIEMSWVGPEPLR